MNIIIQLNEDQARKLIYLYSIMKDPDVSTLDGYVNELFSSLLSQMWKNLRKSILN